MKIIQPRRSAKEGVSGKLQCRQVRLVDGNQEISTTVKQQKAQISETKITEAENKTMADTGTIFVIANPVRRPSQLKLRCA